MSGSRKINRLNLLTSVMIVAGLVFLSVGLWKSLSHADEGSQGTLLAIQSRELLSESSVSGDSSLRGEATAPFTLIEFGDYQCPPCRALHGTLGQFLNKNRKMLNLQFRNLPLVSLHPHAMETAVFAETFRHTPMFWRVHDQLMQVDMGFPNIDHDLKRIARGSGVSPIILARQKSAATQAVVADMKDAHALGLDATPSLLLCCPDGRVYHVDGLSQVQTHIASYSHGAILHWIGRL